MIGPHWLSPRRVLAVAIVLLAAPTVVAGVAHTLGGGADAGEAAFDDSVDDLTIVSAQGRSPDVAASPGGIEIVNTTSKAQVWSHGVDRCMRYYDADPVDSSTILFSANCRADGGDRVRLAFEYDWRREEIDRLFRVPFDTHDFDRLGPHTYAVADIADQRAYVYNYTADEATTGRTFRGNPIRDSTGADREWTFDFTERFPPSDGGEEGYDGDYTHLNDVDAVDGGRAFLLSPRDFNRVLLVNRSTKDVEWTLGEQYDTSILDGQHHPVLIERDPPTVLVGDSNNHRVVEYRRTDGDWERTWTYRFGLNWPRSVTRLPNANTLIVDTGNDRALEVAPDGSVVWEYETSFPNPYDAARYAHGDEPKGPTMASVQSAEGRDGADEEGGGVTLLERYHRIAGFVLPIWVGKWAFAALVGAAALAVAWLAGEAGLAVRRRRR